MPQIRPITELRNTTAISDLCHRKKEPIFITKNGYGDLVVMSLETYERQMAMIEVYEKLTIGEKQIAEGQLMDGQEVFEKLRSKYGRKI